MTIIGASKVTYYITRCVISTYKPFYKAMSSDIPSGRVHLDVCWIDQSASLPSLMQLMLLIYPSYI